MNSPVAREVFDMLSQRLTAMDAEIRSIRAAIFQISDAQQRAIGPEAGPVRTAEDFVRQPD